MYLELFIISFSLTIILLIFLIPLLRCLKYGQKIRIDGPKEHLKKAGTPTMGGIAIGISSLSLFTYFFHKEPYFLLYIIPIFFYMLIGFFDDLLIIKGSKKRGLSVKTKLFLQILVVGVYYFIYLHYGLSTEITLLYKTVDLKWGYGLFILLLFLSTTNAVNISDGVDGLAGGLMIITLASISFLGYYHNNNTILSMGIILIAAVMGFLCYNINPAKVFMGNTGSLLLGAAIASLMIGLKMELITIGIAFVFLIETLSVIIQVIYFKITKGKRIFLMSPLHHHFELKGYSEWQVDILFWFMAFLSAVITIILII